MNQMEEKGVKMYQVEELLKQVLTRLDTLERKVDTLGDKFDKMNIHEATKKQKNAVRRQIYREKIQAAQKGLIPLPEHHCMMRRDRRMDPKVYIAWGVEYGRMNQPYIIDTIPIALTYYTDRSARF